MEADLRRLLEAFKRCEKPKISLSMLMQAIRQSGEQLYGERSHGLKLKQEILLFNRVFNLEKDQITLCAEVSSPDQAAELLPACGLRSDTSLVIQAMEKQVGVARLHPYALPEQYPVLLASTAAVVDQWVSELYTSRAKLVGFDTESPVFFRKGAKKEQVALLQLACANSCLLVHLSRLDCVPPSLTALLKDPTVAKAGFGVLQDFQLLSHQLGLHPRSGLDVSVACGALGLPQNEIGTLGVQTGAASLLCLYTKKSKKVACSNWAGQLNSAQVTYAATDAVLSLNCTLQALLLRPGLVVPGLCSLPSDLTLALSTGHSTIIVSHSPDQNASLLVALTKCGDTPLRWYEMTGGHASSSLLTKLRNCGSLEEAERLLEPGRCFHSQYLTISRITSDLL